MRKIVTLLFMFLFLSVINVPFALAGGDKVRGENGKGSVNQVQIQDPPPFQ